METEEVVGEGEDVVPVESEAKLPEPKKVPLRVSLKKKKPREHSSKRKKKKQQTSDDALSPGTHSCERKSVEQDPARSPDEFLHSTLSLFVCSFCIAMLSRNQTVIGLPNNAKNINVNLCSK